MKIIEVHKTIYPNTHKGKHWAERQYATNKEFYDAKMEIRKDQITVTIREVIDRPDLD